MKRPAIFFDRDNTLISCDEYLGDPEQVTLIDGAAEAVARARRLGYATVIFSNQSGVARGYFTEEAVHSVNQRIDEMLRDGDAKAIIDRHEFCPFHPEASIEKYRQESPMRKPGPGMLHQAAEALKLDLSKSWVIGDAPRDIEAGHAAGCRTILFTDVSLKPSLATRAEQQVEADFTAATLKEAMDIVEEHTDHVLPSPMSPPPPPPPLPPPSPPPEPHAAEAPVPTITKMLAQSQPHSTARLESLANEILQEMRRNREQPTSDFSVSKLMAGIVQILVLAVLFMAFLNREGHSLLPLMLFALTLQTMAIALLIMGRQR